MRAAFLLLLLTALTACSSEKPATTPEGGLQAFGRAVFSGDERAVWESLTPDVHALFANALDEMRRMDGMVGYLQSSEQNEVRERAGLDRLATFESPYDLFAYVFNPTAVEASDRFIAGLDPSVLEMIDERNVSIITDAGQHFTLARGDDGLWRVQEPVATLAARRIDRIVENRENLEATVTLFGTGTNLREEMIRFGVLLPDDATAAR